MYCPNIVTIMQQSSCLHWKKSTSGSWRTLTHCCILRPNDDLRLLWPKPCVMSFIFKNTWAPPASLPPVLKCHLQGLLSDCSWGLGGILISFSLTSVAVKIKKPIKTKFRMPVFNWVALKPNQINGTVFNEIDDERILEVSFLLGRKWGALSVQQS